MSFCWLARTRIQLKHNQYFYSWQSDSPSSTNRNFIKSVLEKAIQLLKKGSEDIQVELRVDTATDALPGSPDIAASIFEKISNSQISLCDVTIINSPSTVGKNNKVFNQENCETNP
ncbi:MAG TPA: hypothetical protein IGS53_26290 [Leptolyngbyaceae cyanobacterium M33_DOE_097]|nr:hypothetical protein [Leptolyngbyaceae cyanobacterium M33_DOE_097]